MDTFVLRQSVCEDFALVLGHEKAVVPVHALVQSEGLRFHATLFVHLLPVRRLTVSTTVLYDFASTAATHRWEQFCAICAAIVPRIRRVVVVLTHHGR